MQRPLTALRARARRYGPLRSGIGRLGRSRAPPSHRVTCSSTRRPTPGTTRWPPPSPGPASPRQSDTEHRHATATPISGPWPRPARETPARQTGRPRAAPPSARRPRRPVPRIRARRPLADPAGHIGVVVVCMIFVWLQLHPNLLLSNTTPPGGDMGAHVWGPGLPARPPAPELPALRLDARLVRRLPRLPVLHGRPGPGRRSASTSCCPTGSPSSWSGGRPRLPCRSPPSPRAPVPAPLPRPGAARGVHAALPVRHDVHDLRRQHRLHAGRRVRLRDQPDDPARLPGVPLPGPRDRPPPGDHGRAVRPRGRLPPAPACWAWPAWPPSPSSAGTWSWRCATPSASGLAVRSTVWWLVTSLGTGSACSPPSGSCRSCCGATT